MLFVYLQKAASPPVDNTGANQTSASTDMLMDPALIIKDRPVSVSQNMRGWDELGWCQLVNADLHLKHIRNQNGHIDLEVCCNRILKCAFVSFTPCCLVRGRRWGTRLLWCQTNLWLLLKSFKWASQIISLSLRETSLSFLTALLLLFPLEF